MISLLVFPYAHFYFYFLYLFALLHWFFWTLGGDFATAYYIPFLYLFALGHILFFCIFALVPGFFSIVGILCLGVCVFSIANKPSLSSLP